MSPRVTKVCAGAYEMREGDYVVSVFWHDDLGGWVAGAGWDQHLYTDILPTKRDAMREARQMLKDNPVLEQTQ